MNAQTAKVEENLKFNEIKSGRHTASGVLMDKDRNMFSVEIKGTNKADVKKFIDYELKQAKNGEGIKTNLSHPPAKKPKALAKVKAAKMDAAANDKLHKQTAWRGVSIKIKLLELQNKTHKPHKIRFTIDPPIDSGKSMDFPIDRQKEANIQCDVSIGKVDLQLFEFTDVTKTTSILRARQTATPYNPAMFNVSQLKKEGVADWNIRVLGNTSSTFTLTMDIFVM